MSSPRQTRPSLRQWLASEQNASHPARGGPATSNESSPVGAPAPRAASSMIWGASLRSSGPTRNELPVFALSEYQDENDDPNDVVRARNEPGRAVALTANPLETRNELVEKPRGSNESPPRKRRLMSPNERYARAALPRPEFGRSDIRGYGRADTDTTLSTRSCTMPAPVSGQKAVGTPQAKSSGLFKYFPKPGDAIPAASGPNATQRAHITRQFDNGEMDIATFTLLMGELNEKASPMPPAAPSPKPSSPPSTRRRTRSSLKQTKPDSTPKPPRDLCADFDDSDDALLPPATTPLPDVVVLTRKKTRPRRSVPLQFEDDFVIPDDDPLSPPKKRLSRKRAKKAKAPSSRAITPEPVELPDQSHSEDFVKSEEPDCPQDEDTVHVGQGDDTDVVDFETPHDEPNLAPAEEEVEAEDVTRGPELKLSDLPEIQDVDDDDVNRFRHRLRLFLEELWRETKALWSRGGVTAKWPICLRMASLIGHTSIDLILRLFIVATPLNVQKCFGREQWNLVDMEQQHFDAFESVQYNDRCSGVYRNLITSRNENDVIPAGYTGSTVRTFRARVKEHYKRIEVYQNSKNQQNKHYRIASSSEKRSNFRGLTMFNGTIAQGYLFIIEYAWMVITGDHADFGEYNRWIIREHFEFAAKLRKASQFPTPVTSPTNGASPLKQVMKARQYRDTRCKIPLCRRPTFVRAREHECRRRDFTTGDPLMSGFVCGDCGNAIHNSSFEKSSLVEVIHRRILTRVGRAAKRDPPSCYQCEWCLMPQSTAVETRGSNALVDYLCATCKKMHTSNGTMPSQDEFENELARLSHNEARRNRPQDVTCHNCGIAQDRDLGDIRFLEDGPVCTACYRFRHVTGRERTAKLEQYRDHNHHMHAAADAGALNCDHCGVNQNNIPEKFHARDDAHGRRLTLCPRCYKVAYKGLPPRTPLTQEKWEMQQRLTKMRTEGTTIRCWRCNAVEKKGGKKHSHSRNGPLCEHCRIFVGNKWA